MPLNLNRLKKDQILWLYNHRCEDHSHRYTEHTECYLKDKPHTDPIQEKVSAYDIEASNLKATFGIIFSYALLQEDGTMLGRALTPKEIRSGVYDKNLLRECVRDLRQQDKIVGWYSDYFDNAFTRSRCIHYGIEYPFYGELSHVDLWKIARRKLCLHSNRLQVCCEFFNIPAKAHPIKTDVWLGAMSGRKKALDWIWEHNKEDVESTLAVYHKLIPYTRRSKTSV